jgi:hypothetical protein
MALHTHIIEGMNNKPVRGQSLVVIAYPIYINNIKHI